MTDDELIEIQKRVSKKYAEHMAREGLSHEQQLNTTLCILAGIIVATSEQSDDKHNLKFCKKRLAFIVEQARDLENEQFSNRVGEALAQIRYKQ